MNSFINIVTDAIRMFMYKVAQLLNKLSGGHLTPNTITYTGLVTHVPVALLIAQGYFGYASLGIVIFGLFDALDGALAKVQGKVGNAGMLLDASTDRMKEVLLYCGVGYVIAASGTPNMATWAVSALGMSLCVSYIKAKGETAIKDLKLTPNEINQLFSDGIFRFQIRMVVLILGLLSNQLILAIIIITIGSGLTAISRLYTIMKKLSNVQG